MQWINIWNRQLKVSETVETLAKLIKLIKLNWLIANPNPYEHWPHYHNNINAEMVK